MKRTKLILMIVLLLLIAAFFILRFHGPRERTGIVFDKAFQEPDGIQIYSPEGEIKLALKDGKWILKGEMTWEADSLKVQSFFEDVIRAEYAKTPMSTHKDAIRRYGLQDEEALHVKVSSGLRTRHVLFANLGNAWDYFRYAGDSEVYQVRSKVAQFYKPLPINWRSPFLLHYWEDELREIRVEHENNSYTLLRLVDQWFYQDSKHDFAVDFGNYALVKILSILQNFRSYIFTSGDDPEMLKAFANPMATVWITDTEDKVRKLEFAKFDNSRHMLRIDDDSSVIFQVEFDTVFRFTRHPDIFKRKSF